MDPGKITHPTLLLDKEKCINNINRIKAKADRNNVILRPHFKTHQSPEVGSWFKAAGIHSITVSSVSMAIFFARMGWEDIMIAFPFNPLESNEINNLAGSINLAVMVTGIESAKLLTESINKPVNVYIKTDAGYNRSGTKWTEKDTFIEIAAQLKTNKNTSFKGLINHAGDTYKTNNIGEVKDIYKRSVERCLQVKNYYSDSEIIISVGDTPSISILDDLGDIDEVRPGNFVFYDLMQYSIGSCKLENIAVTLACPVVDIRPTHESVVIYGGGVHLSKEYIMYNGKKVFGMVVSLKDGAWNPFTPELLLTGLSQEHGIIECPREMINNFSIGDIIGVFPVHSCLTANLMKSYLQTDGKLATHFSGY